MFCHLCKSGSYKESLVNNADKSQEITVLPETSILPNDRR